jgi:spore coat polysaccharide biosynthesis predicted glycosyltransferase SpsG
MQNPILILTECGSDIGFGHLTRCLSLAHGFRCAGKNVQIWVAADALSSEKLPEFVRAVRWYGLDGELEAEAARAHAILLDSFKISAEDVERIFRINPRTAVIDDYPRREYTAGVVIDWTVGAENYAFPQRRPGVRYLLGSRYCALRPEFQSVAKREFLLPVRSLLVTFGGSDVRALTRPVVDMLQREFPDLEKLVVAGPALHDPSFQALEDTNTSFHSNVGARQMQAMMAQADIAVSGGGQTLYELASQGLPPVIVSIVDNQEDDIRGFIRAGFGVYAGQWDQPDLLDSITKCIGELGFPDNRTRQAAAGRQCVDGHGAERLTSALLAQWEGTSLYG